MKKIRKINKVVAFVLALALVLGMSSPAFALPVSGEVVENPADMETISLGKTFLLENNNTVSPAEVFEFTIAFDSARDTQYANAAVPIPYFSLDGIVPVLTGTVAFAQGEATTVPGNTKEINLTMPIYEHVGVFTYKLTETQNDTAGVGYDGRDLFLKVYVINNPEFGDEEPPEATKFIRYAVLYEVNEEEIKKVEGFENDFSAGYLDITKKVTGNMGEKDRFFELTVNLTAPDWQAGEGDEAPTYREIVSPVNIDGGSHEANPDTVTFENGKANITLHIKHDETITIENLPYGATWQVAENNYTDEGYTIKINDTQMYSGEVVVDSVTDEVDTPSATAEIVNDKVQDVETGIILENLPYIMIMIIVTGGLVGFTLKKRRTNIEL